MKKRVTLKRAPKTQKRKTAVKREVSEALASDLANLNDPPHINDSEEVKTGLVAAKKKERLLADKLDEENE